MWKEELEWEYLTNVAENEVYAFAFSPASGGTGTPGLSKKVGSTALMPCLREGWSVVLGS